MKKQKSSDLVRERKSIPEPIKIKNKKKRERASYYQKGKECGARFL